MNKFLILVIFLIFGVSSVLAQQDLQISFPIAELGNCNNAQTCKIYCDQVENRETCKQFAKSKGLYKDKVNERQVELLSLAKQELGCDTIISCRDFCSQEVNYQKCQSFAQKHGLTQIGSEDEELLSKAKQNLNCDSVESCKTLCDQQENYVKCAALLQDQVTQDDRAMFEKYKPLIKQHLGCDSLVTCMAFCINPLNTKKCEEFGKVIEAEQGGTRSYDSSEPPEVWCPKVSPECSWDGKLCICPGVEGPTESVPNEPGEVWCPKIGPYCVWDGSSCTCWDDCVKNGGTWTGTKCELPQPTAESKEAWCSKLGQYCVWDGSSCTCWDECVKAGGKWTGQTCEYQGGTNQTTLEPNVESPEVSCVRNPDCKWTGEVCQCTPQLAPQTEPTPQPTVQGVTTNRGLLFQILDFFF